MFILLKYFAIYYIYYILARVTFFLTTLVDEFDFQNMHTEAIRIPFLEFSRLRQKEWTN